ncbi:N-acetylmuramoyl-L-alanine amidase [Streptosporangiaceae bacterium NEAU-GS5]|nr:N-acetylmuramoyl-L-alanine amidase [Streptosporangiaceae bacterium NEAU-GS5]
MLITRRTLLSMGSGLAGHTLLGGRRHPTLHTRAEWGAMPPKIRATVLHHGPRFIVVHHTATPNTTDLSFAAACRLSRGIQRYHMRHNHWDDMGEHFTVGRGGYVMEGRNHTLPAIQHDNHVVGAHVRNHNNESLGIETEGTYMTMLPTDEQMAALVRLISWLCSVYALDPETCVLGHRDLNHTSCPGDEFYAFLPELRRRVAGRLGRPVRRQLRVGPVGPSGLPGPAHMYDHGPAV